VRPHIRPFPCHLRPPSPRLRCRHGSKAAGYLSEKQLSTRQPPYIRAATGGAAGRVEDGRLSGTAGSTPAPSQRVGRGSSATARRVGTFRPPIPHPPGPPPSNPNPHPPGERRAEPENR